MTASMLKGKEISSTSSFSKEILNLKSFKKSLEHFRRNLPIQSQIPRVAQEVLRQIIKHRLKNKQKKQYKIWRTLTINKSKSSINTSK